MPKQLFARCLVVINPSSTRSEQAVAQVDEIATYFTKDSFSTLSLQKKDFKNTSKLRSALGDLRKDDLLVIVGGDGTISLIVNLVMAHSTLASRDATILPLKAGNASDIAHMLHGKRANDTAWIMNHGVRQPIFTLSVKIVDNKHTTLTRALAYTSFGAIGYTAQEIDGIGRSNTFFDRYRLTILLKEAYAGFAALLRAEKFLASLNGSKSRSYYDIVFTNGSRMAKLYRLHTRLYEQRFARLVVRHKHPALLTHVLSLGRAFLYRKKTANNQHILLHDSVLAQIDGEVHRLPAGTHVQVSQDGQPYYALVGNTRKL